MNCAHCGKETDDKYIIDAVGSYYCSEDCIEDYQENSSVSFDDKHPYEDAYLMLRRLFIEIIDQWEDGLSQRTSNIETEVDDLLGGIDELISNHQDFINSEGDDGPYAWEIYQYTLKLRELQQRIVLWRLNRKLIYWVTGGDYNYGSMDDNQKEMYDKVCTNLYMTGYEEFILYVIKHHQHPFHWGLNYVFDNLEMAKEAFEILNAVGEKHGVSISIVEYHKCEE